MSRISREDMFMEVAEVVGKRGTCDRARVGAVLVDADTNNIVSIGYNGSPTGEVHCDEAGHIMHNNHCIRTVHAEENCINRAVQPQEGEKYNLYVTHYPCVKCQATLYEWCMKNKVKLLVHYRVIYGTPTAFEGLKEVHNTLQFSRI